jgi:hypothetical protein
MKEILKFTIKMVSFKSRRFKTPYYGSANWTEDFSGMVVYYCNAWPSGLHVCHDTWTIKVKP